MVPNESKKYQALQQQRIELTKQRETLVAEGKVLRALDDPSDEQVERMDAVGVEVEELDGKLKAAGTDLARYERLFEIERDAPAATVPLRSTDEPLVATPAVERDPKRGFRDVADFALSVKRAHSPEWNGRADSRLLPLVAQAPPMGAAPTDYMESGGSSGEMFLTPPEFREAIWEIAFAEDGILAFLGPSPTNRDSVKFNKDETTPWGAAGVQAAWTDAGEQITKSKHPSAQGRNELYKLAALVLDTEELDQDAPNLADKLTRGAGRAINWKAEEAVMWGDGAGKPKGWMHSTGPIVVVAKEGSQAAATINVQNIGKMFSRCLNPQSAAWFCAPSTLPQFIGLTIGDQPVWTPPSEGIKGAPAGLLLGRPIRFTHHAQVLGTEGDIQFVDPEGYMLNIHTSGLRMDSSIHLYFDYAVKAYRWLFRLGGQPILSAAVSPAKGSDKISHFVTLAVRS